MTKAVFKICFFVSFSILSKLEPGLKNLLKTEWMISDENKTFALDYHKGFRWMSHASNQDRSKRSFAIRVLWKHPIHLNPLCSLWFELSD